MSKREGSSFALLPLHLLLLSFFILSDDYMVCSVKPCTAKPCVYEDFTRLSFMEGTVPSIYGKIVTHSALFGSVRTKQRCKSRFISCLSKRTSQGVNLYQDPTCRPRETRSWDLYAVQDGTSPEGGTAWWRKSWKAMVYTTWSIRPLRDPIVTPQSQRLGWSWVCK